MTLGRVELERLAQAGPAAISHLVDVRPLDPSIIPLTRSRRTFAGRAHPVALPDGDVSGIARAIAEVSEGDVLVIEAGPPPAAVGGLTALDAAGAGVGAIVLEGFACDSDEVEHAGVPLFARGWAPTARRLGRPSGRYGTTARCGGVDVSMGDVVVGGADGVMVVADRDARAALDGLEELEARERQLCGELASGARLWDLIAEMGDDRR